MNSNTVFEVLISFGSEFHTFGPQKENLDLYNSVFGFGTRILSDDEYLVSYDPLLFAETIRFDKYSGANSFLDLYINKTLWKSRVKPKTIKLAFVASPLSTQH